ncbi:hypothetical protein NC652_040059 [Populus alba x Populus x berolinensis]|nr:hypothetical protein NC652_040059 [Populus alba x Populus x berolinensis]
MLTLISIGHICRTVVSFSPSPPLSTNTRRPIMLIK